MTRFACAAGSKASNERVPEDATPWSVMKRQLMEKNQAGDDAKKMQEMNKQREENYNRFLENVAQEKSQQTEWAKFPSDDKNKIKKSGVKRNLSEEAPPTSEKAKVKKLKKKKAIEDMVHSEPQDLSPGTSLGQSKIKKSEKTKSDELPQNVISNLPELESFNKDNIEMKSLPNLKRKKGKKPKAEVLLTESDETKIKKKNEKKMRQLEKKKLFKNESNPNLDKNRKKGPKPERRKKTEETMMINGKEVEIQYYDGFPVKKEDAVRIQQLRKQMISKGLPRSEIRIALKLERRKAEKALAREKKKVCFNCRKSGHNLSECPELGNELAQSCGTGICFKCGSTEHTHFECKVVRGQEFKHAQCFICHEQGHIARQCPDNPRGLYPKGGACKVCSDVTHLKKDCPKFQAQQQTVEDGMLETLNTADNPDILDTTDKDYNIKPTKRPNKIVKF